MSTSREAQFDRSPTRILRDKGIDPSIKCTSTLVANYNAEEDANVREAMRMWLDTHIEEFSKINPGSIPKKTITEFMNLAEIKVKDPADAELVRRVYATVRHVVTQERKDCQIYYVLGLEYILSTVDSSILQEDARNLISLANCLIEMTDPQNGPLTRATFAYNASCLHALERVLIVLHELERHCPKKSCLTFFEDTMKKHLNRIITCQPYYPIAYQALLIKENINKLLTKDIKSLLINAGRRAFYAFCGGLHIFQGVRELAVLKFDFGAMESGVQKFREAFRDIGRYRMTEIQEIISAASEAVEHDDFGIFQQCYDRHKKVLWSERMKWSKQRMIRYALVSHLCLFCTEKHSTSNQNRALYLLLQLATKNEGKQWRKDQQIFEAIVEALVAVGKKDLDYRQTTINALDSITRSQNAQQKRVVDGLLQGKKTDEVVKGCSICQENDNGCVLFTRTRQILGFHRTASIFNRNQEALREYYTDDSFARVSLFSDKNDQRHISTFDFNLEQYEKVVVTRDRNDQSSIDKYNQREDNLQRTMKERKPIKMQNFFRAHGISTPGFQENAQRILVIGNPGTGKTCLSKRICFDWANGSWGTKFTHVYLLPIRRLTETSFGADADLPLIVYQVIYKTCGTMDSNKALYEEIKDNLYDATTLLILDGYDEAGEMAMDLVSSAFTLNCSLLILSRPHSVNDIRPRIDIEVECLEFSDKQLESFILEELNSKDGEDLIEFLSENLTVRNTCRVAVNAQIVTKIWRITSSKAELTESNCANLYRLYFLMVNYVWKRFTEKTEHKFNRDSMYHSLECIAFESFKKNLVEIPELIVLDYAQETEKAFRDSGFLLFMEEGSVFQFAHLTFHEYFAGCHLTKLLKSTSVEDKKKAERFISEHKYIETSRVMLSFMTQCYCMRDDIEANLEAFKDLMQVLDSNPLPTMSLQHLLLRMRTLDAFLPCGLDKTEVHTNDDVMLIVNDAMDALKHWFGYELDGEHKGWSILIREDELRIPIVDVLERMPSLFNRFPDLLKPVLLNDHAKSFWDGMYLLDIARIGKLNPQYARQCIVPLLDNWTTYEQAKMIQVCALIGPICAEPTLDHLKKLLEDQDKSTRKMATEALVKFLELFPKREDVRQLVVNASKGHDCIVRCRLAYELGDTTFTPEEAPTFVWSMLNKAMKDEDRAVRGAALRSCVRLYQTLAKSLDEVMEFIREFVVSSNFNNDLDYASWAIKDLIQKAPEKGEELLALMKAICRDIDKDVRSESVSDFLEIIKRSSLKREVLFNVAFDVFKDGYPDVQFELLPFLFSFDKKEGDAIDKVNEWIANCQDLNEGVREKANSCREANALLSKYAIEEIHEKFYDQDVEMQMEIVAQFDLRKMEGTNATGAIAEMAAHCLGYDDFFKPSRSLLEKLSKKELFTRVALEKWTEVGHINQKYLLQQPLSHLLKYYWSTRDIEMTDFIVDKLLLSTVIFEKKGGTEVEVTLREKGAIVKQTAPVEVVEELLSICKASLKMVLGLNFH